MSSARTRRSDAAHPPLADDVEPLTERVHAAHDDAPALLRHVGVDRELVVIGFDAEHHA
jgi:hypothetical protein